MNTNNMATRNPADVKFDKDSCTAFVLHKSQQQLFAGIQRKIVDYTEHKLLRVVETVTDAQQRLILIAMINDYRAGHIAIAWKRGMPVYLKVTKEA